MQLDDGGQTAALIAAVLALGSPAAIATVLLLDRIAARATGRDFAERFLAVATAGRCDRRGEWWAAMRADAVARSRGRGRLVAAPPRAQTAVARRHAEHVGPTTPVRGLEWPDGRPAAVGRLPIGSAGQSDHRGVGVNVSSRFDVSGFGVIVTGGASGLGLAYGEVLAAHGARVTLIDVDAGAVEAQAARLQGEGLDVRPAVADVTDHGALDRAVDAAAETYGRLDVAFANAGIDPGVGFVGAWAGGERPRVDEGALENYTDERWNRVIDINLNGVFATARAAARHMRPRGFGRIIVTTSLAANKVEPAIGAAYMAAKAGAKHLTHCLALELAADGITANAIAPGFFVTNIGGGHAHNPDLQAAIAKDVPMHRVGRPDDIKALALFLASPASDYITGQEIVIDGGWGLGVAD
jgi:NAD(P)-dependent dehydrogenase (short-subunit alcohol dehydrogenase family)